MHHLDGPRRAALRLVSRAADRVVVNALAIRDHCLAEGVAPERIALVRNGIDVVALDREARVAPAPAPPWDASAAVVLQVANMHHPVKGHEDLLRAFRRIAREVPTARLLLVGEGALRPGLEALARELRIAERVHFAGHRHDVPALLARATVVVSASHAEGLSNAVLEAMAARRPIVATAVGGTPEVVRDGEAGLLAPPHAPEALADRVVVLLRDGVLARRMGEAGRAVVARECSVGLMRQRFDALYRGLLAERSAPDVPSGDTERSEVSAGGSAD
jgi:glycosyltransferase involved in cell wall biosynthesis